MRSCRSCMRGLGHPGCSCRPWSRVSSVYAHDSWKEITYLQDEAHEVSVCHSDWPVRFVLTLPPLQFLDIQHSCPRASSWNTEVMHNVQVPCGVIDARSLNRICQRENVQQAYSGRTPSLLIPIHFKVWPFNNGSRLSWRTVKSAKRISWHFKFCDPSMLVDPSLNTTNNHSLPATIETNSPSNPMNHLSTPPPDKKVKSPSVVAITTFPLPWMSASDFERRDFRGGGPPAARPTTLVPEGRSYVHSPCVAQVP